MSVVQLENCYAAVVEPLDTIADLREASLSAQDIGGKVVLYGQDDEFFDKLEEARRAGKIKLNSLIGQIAVTLKI